MNFYKKKVKLNQYRMLPTIEQLHDKFPFYDVVPHLIYIADKEGHIVHVNKAFANFSEKAENDLQIEGGLGWLHNVHPEDIPRTIKLWTYSLETEKPYENVYRLMNAEGKYVWMLTRAIRTDLFGDEYAWIGTCTDISKQMELNEKLGEQKDLLTTVLDQLPVAVVIADPTGKVIIRNGLMSVIWRKELPMLENFDEYNEIVAFHKDGRRYTAQDWPLYQSLVNKTRVTKEITEILRGDTTPGLISVSSTPVMDKNGKVVAGIMICEDIQDKVILEKEKLEALNAAQAAMEANKMKSTFLANMSHDIRTPMNGVLGCTQLLMDTPLNSEQRDYIDIIVDCGRVLIALINDILDISKIEAGRMELEQAPFPLESMIDGLVQIASASLLTMGKTLKIRSYKVNLPKFVKGDRRRLEQIVQNLMSNAVKFTPENGHIWVNASATPTDESLVEFRCSVVDDGIGIDKHVQEKLFSPFVQADTSTTRKYGGTGLGLSICKDLVTLMGGKIWVESDLGHGSNFTFVIPMQVVPPDEVPEEEKTEYLADPHEREESRILMAEDNKINAILAKKLLQGEHYIDIDWAKNGMEAVQMFSAKAYDIILMDCQMPVMDGFEASRRIRETGTKLPIVAFTASVMKEEQIKCRESGMDDIVLKPFDKRTLVKKMDTLIKKYRDNSSS